MPAPKIGWRLELCLSLVVVAAVALAYVFVVFGIYEYYLWLGTKAHAMLSPFENLIVSGVLAATMIGALPLSVMATVTAHKRQAWPSVRVVVVTAVVVACSQVAFIALGSVDFTGDLLNPFFLSKRISFVMVFASAISLALVTLLIQRHKAPLAPADRP
jgi:hypothetical protein